MEKTLFTKEETLDFIDFLRKKENVTLDDQILHRRSFFNRWEENTYQRAKMLLDVIRKAKSTQNAYGEIAHLEAKQNNLWRTFPPGGYMFSEDWEEYQKTHPGELPEHIRKWSNASKGLSSRNIIFQLFPTEYLLFKHRHESEDEQKLTVTEVSLKGWLNGYRYQRSDIQRAQAGLDEQLPPAEKKVMLSYSSSTSGIGPEEGIVMAKYLCEVCDLDRICIYDMDEDNAIVVKKERHK